VTLPSDGSNGDDDVRPARRIYPTSRQLRHLARRAVADDRPPEVPIAPQRIPSVLSFDVERSTVDLVLRTAEALVGSGATVTDATVALHRMAAGFGLTSCQISITFNTIVVSSDRRDDPITRFREASVRTSDYTRLAALIELTDDAGDGKIDLIRAHDRLDQIVAAPHPYRRWVVTLALGVMAFGVAIFLDGSLIEATVAGATTMAVDRVLRFARHRGLPFLFQQAAGAIIATTVAMTLLWAQVTFDWPSALRVSPSIVVASGIVVLLAGLSLVNAAEDGISGFPLTAAARGFEVLVSTVGIVVGIAFVLNVSQRIGIPLTIAESPVSRSVIVSVISGAVIAGSWAMASYARSITVLLAMPAGALAAAGWAALREVNAGPPTAAFVAAVIVGLVASTVADHLNDSPIVVSACGVVPLLPGLAIYSALFALVQEDNIIRGGAQLIGALGIGLALAAGVTLGEYLARPLRPESDLWQRRVHRRARGTRI
jgi:uncharacterized membrane protein YjjP (DUF1212 family)